VSSQPVSTRTLALCMTSYDPDGLQSLIEAEGWHAQIDATRWFIHGRAEPAC